MIELFASWKRTLSLAHGKNVLFRALPSPLRRNTRGGRVCMMLTAFQMCTFQKGIPRIRLPLLLNMFQERNSPPHLRQILGRKTLAEL